MRLYYYPLIIVIFAVNSLPAYVIPVGRTDTDPIYEFNRELYLRGYGNPQRVLFGWLDYPSVQGAIQSTNNLNKITQPLSDLLQGYRVTNQSASLHLTISPEYAFSKDSKKIYWMTSSQLDYRASNNITAQVAYRSDSRLVHDSDYTGKRWLSTAGYAEMALLSYAGEKLSIDLGRQRHLWGMANGGNSLILSSWAMPLDGISASYRLNRYVSIHAIAAYLSRSATDSLSRWDVNTVNRYFSAHALRISPAQWLDIVFKESVVYGGPGRRFELQYALPLLIYHFEQLNEGSDDNTMFGLEAVVRYKNRIAGFCEIMLDDYQIENKTPSDREPSMYGVLLGGLLFDWPVESSYWEINYDRVANWTYDQLYDRNRYIHQNRSLGYSWGPDNDLIRIAYNYHINSRFHFGVELSKRRQGEGRITTPWTTPWLDNPDYSEKFPSGVVRTEKGVRFKLKYFAKNIIQSKLSVEYADIENDSNIIGNDKGLWKANCEITFNLPNLSWRFDHE
ncbi:MAG: capsule assembly Wzi family protein [candidate division Zixibacteria bacterium]|nr:capsule assembly Wzi family protein [candidate division Zixibacteria bacterium]